MKEPCRQRVFMLCSCEEGLRERAEPELSFLEAYPLKAHQDPYRSLTLLGIRLTRQHKDVYTCPLHNETLSKASFIISSECRKDSKQPHDVLEFIPSVLLALV